MNPASGRFTQQDSYLGSELTPHTLHKYLYADADPIDRRDPSGFNSIADQMAALDIQGVLNVVNKGEKILQVYDKVQSAIDVLLGVRQVLSFISATDGDLTSILPRTFPPRLNFQDAAAAFVSGSAKAIELGSPSWLAGYAAEYMKGKRFSAYVVYLPVIIPSPPSLFDTGIQINGKPLKAGVGAPGAKAGSLGGVGMVMGHERTLFRMDIGPTPGGHVTGRGNEITTFNEPPCSFHVYNWNGGPR